MARLLGIRIKNYRALADFQLGQVEYAKGDSLPRLTCLIGPNGSGKSTVLDAFGFVADCLLEGVEAACDKPNRGGYDRLHTQGTHGPIEFESSSKPTIPSGRLSTSCTSTSWTTCPRS